MKTYNVVFNKESDAGVYAISVVQDPAMESQFITLSKDDGVSLNIKLQSVDEKEHTLLGVALIPDKEIYRNQDGQEYNIVFSKDTIQEVAHNFMLKGYQTNSSVEHDPNQKISGVSIVESWMVKDPNQDTANAYGLPKEDIKEGTWVVKMKCDNQEIYNKAVNGEIKGFSIDGLFSLEEINLKKEEEMSDNSFLEKFKALFSSLVEESNKQTKIDLGTATVMQGDTSFTIEFEGDELTEGANVFAIQGEERIALPIGNYTLEDGSTLVVSEEGVVGEVRPAEAQELTSEDMQEMEQLIKSVLIKYAKNEDLESIKTELGEIKKSNETLKKENEDLKKEVLELKKTPAAQKKKSAPSQKEYKDMTNKEKMLHNRGLI